MEENTIYPPKIFAGKYYNNESGGNKMFPESATKRILKFVCGN